MTTATPAEFDLPNRRRISLLLKRTMQNLMGFCLRSTVDSDGRLTSPMTTTLCIAMMETHQLMLS